MHLMNIFWIVNLNYVCSYLISIVLLKGETGAIGPTGPGGTRGAPVS